MDTPLSRAYKECFILASLDHLRGTYFVPIASAADLGWPYSRLAKCQKAFHTIYWLLTLVLPYVLRALLNKRCVLLHLLNFIVAN